MVLNQQKLFKGHSQNTEMQNTAELFRGFGSEVILLLFFLQYIACLGFNITSNAWINKDPNYFCDFK